MLASARPVDNTDLIRRLKHSRKIAEDVNKFMAHKINMERRNQFAKFVAEDRRGTPAEQEALEKIVDPAQIERECAEMCPFLVEHYPDLFGRVYRDELDTEVLFELLNALADVEDGDLTQEQGSEKVGRILYRMYADSRARQARREEKDGEKSTGAESTGAKAGGTKSGASKATLTWKEYRNGGR